MLELELCGGLLGGAGFVKYSLGRNPMCWGIRGRLGFGKLCRLRRCGRCGGNLIGWSVSGKQRRGGCGSRMRTS